MTNPIPNGYHTVTPSLTLKDTKKALEFYQKAFDAKVIDSFPNLSGNGLMHATIQIGNSILMMGDEMANGGPKSAESVGGSPMSLFIYVPNVDDAFKKAIAAGAKVQFPVAEMFWGDRAGSLQDPFGYSWMLATHTRDMSKEEIRKEAEAFFANAGKR